MNIDDIMISSQCTITYNKKELSINSISTKALYWSLIENIAQKCPTSKNTWYEKTELALNENEWKTIY